MVVFAASMVLAMAAYAGFAAMFAGLLKSIVRGCN